MDKYILFSQRSETPIFLDTAPQGLFPNDTLLTLIHSDTWFRYAPWYECWTHIYTKRIPEEYILRKILLIQSRR